jgi:hypothetical protein|tara:strand:+ start:1042 stop:1206 length:165 start_codon:yes stop_codon:yes gene_type:complete
MIEYILNNYKDDLLAMAFTYIGIISIVMMFLPKNNIISKVFKEFTAIFTTLFKK